MKNLIKYGGYAGAILAIGSVLNFGYTINAWSADVEELKYSQSMSIYKLEFRQLKREIKQWKTKPSSSPIEQKYINSTIDDLKSDKKLIEIKMNSILTQHN